MRKREKWRYREQKSREKREERREREIFIIILLCNLYYVNVLYVKIKYGMLRVL